MSKIEKVTETAFTFYNIVVVFVRAYNFKYVCRKCWKKEKR